VKSYTVFIAIVVCLVVGLLAWITTTRLSDFNSYHAAIAEESTSGVANEIARFVTEKKRLVALFADEHLPLIRRLAEDPENEILHDQLQRRITDYFPDHFTFTIVDPEGQPYIEDFDGMVGDMCRQDIVEFLSNYQQRPRIHPNSHAYHFDILAPYGVGGSEGILFVSFHADILGGALRSAQTSGHELMLVYPQASSLIEVTSDGARINRPRDDYRLSADETQRIVSHQQVPQTVWQAVDLHEPTLFSDYRSSLIRQSGIIFLLFLTASSAMLSYVRREETLRQAAEKHKDEFLSVVSHELRTPLTSIRGSLSLMANNVGGPLDPQSKSLVDIALKNSMRLETLVNDILDVQKIQAGKMDFVFKTVELGPLVQRCIEDNAGYARQYGSTFALTDCEPGIMVRVDENRMTQVLANLLSNAAKYGAEEDNIQISVTRREDEARISVRDHGPGIPASKHESVFQKFVQVDSSDTRKVGGTGLGLSIVKLIVEANGGKVGFDSEVGVGSTFYVDLPLQA
jgi:signal transduction histidine kinase